MALAALNENGDKVWIKFCDFEQEKLYLVHGCLQTPSKNTENQRKPMEHLAHSKVRRRLVFDDPEPDKQCKAPDEEKLLESPEDAQERLMKEKAKMAAKWNFDFDKEEPLQGPIDWYRKHDNEWIGMRPTQLYMRRGLLLFNLEASVISRKHRVKRQLFPKEMTSQTGKTLADFQKSKNEVMELCIKECQEKWNFDFQNHKPLDGPVIWGWNAHRSLWLGMMPKPTESEESSSQQSSDEAENKDHEEVNENNEVAKEPKEEETVKERENNEAEAENDEAQVEIEEEEIKNLKDEEKYAANDIEMEKKDDNQKTDELKKIEEKLIPIEEQNQVTPKNETDDAVPMVRKRKRGAEPLNETGAKRRISFE